MEDVGTEMEISTGKPSPKTISISQDDELAVGIKRRRKTRVITDEL
jgi:hypothetical protein